MGRLFGTDGVRGVANVEITAELALNMAVAAAHVLAEVGEFEGHKPTAIIGRDTRISGQFLAQAVSAGLASAGVNVIDVGVMPTPGVAHLVAARGADLGVMLSASHNPMPDNGIKLFAKGGHKLADALERAIEDRLGEDWKRPQGGDVGRIMEDCSATQQYVGHVVSTVPHSLKGLRVVVDCANGAASQVGPSALRAAGADVVPMHNEPTGLNINKDCGSTHLESLQETVVKHTADLGVAFDGDADRCLAVDAEGNVVDGDQIMGILAVAFQSRGQLQDSMLVATVMSNKGLQVAMEAADIKLLRTKVGDRYVLEELTARGLSLGGEQSGHVVMPAYATTGDGVLTALHVMARMAQCGKSLAELAGEIPQFPQVLINVSDVDKKQVDHPRIVAAVTSAELQLGETGRVLFRPSGTEPVVRVMVEAAEQTKAQQVAEELAAVVRQYISLPTGGVQAADAGE